MKVNNKMSKSGFWFFMATWALAENERWKREEERHQRKENKNISQQIRRRNVSKSLGQHKYVYLSKKSR